MAGRAELRRRGDALERELKAERDRNALLAEQLGVHVQRRNATMYNPNHRPILPPEMHISLHERLTRGAPTRAAASYVTAHRTHFGAPPAHAKCAALVRPAVNPSPWEHAGSGAQPMRSTSAASFTRPRHPVAPPDPIRPTSSPPPWLKLGDNSLPAMERVTTSKASYTWQGVRRRDPCLPQQQMAAWVQDGAPGTLMRSTSHAQFQPFPRPAKRLPCRPSHNAQLHWLASNADESWNALPRSTSQDAFQPRMGNHTRTPCKPQPSSPPWLSLATRET